MVDEPGRVSKWTLRVAVYGGAVAGVALVAAASTSDDPPVWWWAVGIPLTVVCGWLCAVWIRFRLRHRTPEARRQAIERLEARRREVGRPLDRSRIAHRATRHKRAVLRSGVDATAVVTFLADGHRANEFKHLVYLELDVYPEPDADPEPDAAGPGGEPYQVRTGEYLNAASAGSVSPGKRLHVKVDPQDPQRVAVDWERSLRLQ